MRSSSKPESAQVSRSTRARTPDITVSVNWGVLDQTNILEAIKAHNVKTNRSLIRNQKELARRLYFNTMDIYLTDLSSVCCYLKGLLPFRHVDLQGILKKRELAQLFSSKIMAILSSEARIPLEFVSDSPITHSQKEEFAEAFLVNRHERSLGDDIYSYNKAAEEIICLYISDMRHLNRIIRKRGLSAPEITTKDIIDPSGNLKSNIFIKSFRILVPLSLSSFGRSNVLREDQSEHTHEDMTLRIADLGANSVQRSTVSSAKQKGSVTFSIKDPSPGSYTNHLSGVSLYGESLAEFQEKFDLSQVEKYRNQAKALHSELREKDMMLQEANDTIRELRRQLQDSDDANEDLRAENLSLRTAIDTLKTTAEYESLEKENIRLQEKQAVLRKQLDDALRLTGQYKEQLFIQSRKFDTLIKFVNKECSTFNEIVTKYNLDRDIFEVDPHSFYDQSAMLFKTLINTDDASISIRASTILRHVAKTMHSLIQEGEKLVLRLRIGPLDKERLEGLNDVSILTGLDDVVTLLFEHLGRALC
ncbi:Hypothetical protein DHA2_12074 [Giardia duodenalis]|uniref:Uncharacterized protein n=1 Tax=Giardia intestinalis TaxID=5741 RepID=V6TN16_GIAIN|nr:Hypothetical protein DHA2_12074 [Giardia intestinalis]